MVKDTFFHMTDISIIDSYALFREYQKSHSELESMKCSKNYSLTSFREELIRNIIDFEEYTDPPVALYCYVD